MNSSQFEMTCLQTSTDDSLSPKGRGGGVIQKVPPRTLSQIYENLTASREAWSMVALFGVGLSAFVAMLANGFRLYVLHDS